MNLRYWLMGSILGLVILAAGTSSAEEKSPRDLLPLSTVVYAEIPEPKKILDAVLDHPAVADLQAHPDYQKAWDAPQARECLRVLHHVEDKLGMKWRPATDALVGGGVYLGFDLPTQGVSVFTKATDPQLAKKAIDVTLELARAESAKRGGGDPVKSDEFKGIKLYGLGNVQYAHLGSYLLTTNKAALTRLVIDSYLGDSPSLGSDEQFREVAKSKPAGATAWVYGDLRPLRALGVLKNALNK